MKQKTYLAGLDESLTSGHKVLTRLGQLSTLPERIAREIGIRIQSGSLPAGARIVEAEIAAQFGVSHSPVRDALRLLNKSGLVELMPRRGARVVGVDHAALLDLSQVISCLLTVAMCRALDLSRRSDKMPPREVVKSDAQVLKKLADAGKFSGTAFLKALEQSVEHILARTDYSFLPGIVRNAFVNYSALSQPLLERDDAAEIAANWRLLATLGKSTARDEKFRWNVNLLEFGTMSKVGSQEHLFQATAIAGSRAVMVPSYPEVQVYLNRVDRLILRDDRRHPTLAEQIADKIRESVHSGAITYGDRLTEIDLARRFLTSRGPVREALRILDEQGLIELRPRRGGIVRPLTVREMTEIYDMRAVLSELSLKLAATHGASTRKLWEDAFDTGVDLMERMARAKTPDPIVWIELRRSLGKLIFAVGGNEVLARLFLKFEQRLSTHYLHAAPAGRRRIINNWRKIKQAILAGDPETAASVFRSRFGRVRETVVRERARAGSIGPADRGGIAVQKPVSPTPRKTRKEHAHFG